MLGTQKVQYLFFKKPTNPVGKDLNSYKRKNIDGKQIYEKKFNSSNCYRKVPKATKRLSSSSFYYPKDRK